MANAPQNPLQAAILRLLRPLVRILLRNGVPFAALAELAKQVYVDVAFKEFGIPNRKQTVSRVAVLTGLTRKEVQRLQHSAEQGDQAASAAYNRAARVIAGWVRDPEFADLLGEPAMLPLEGAGKSFAELVKRYSGDVPARAVLDELQRVGAVACDDDDQVQLLTRSYVPAADAGAKLHILGTDVAELIATIDHNLQSTGPDLRFQRKVSYDNLPAEVIPKLKQLSGERGQALIEDLDAWMAAHDRDATPSVSGTGRKHVSVGIYYFEEDVFEDQQDD